MFSQPVLVFRQGRSELVRIVMWDAWAPDATSVLVTALERAGTSSSVLLQLQRQTRFGINRANGYVRATPERLLLQS